MNNEGIWTFVSASCLSVTTFEATSQTKFCSCRQIKKKGRNSYVCFYQTASFCSQIWKAQMGLNKALTRLYWLAGFWGGRSQSGVGSGLICSESFRLCHRLSIQLNNFIFEKLWKYFFWNIIKYFFSFRYNFLEAKCVRTILIWQITILT